MCLGLGPSYAYGQDCDYRVLPRAGQPPHRLWPLKNCGNAAAKNAQSRDMNVRHSSWNTIDGEPRGMGTGNVRISSGWRSQSAYQGRLTSKSVPACPCLRYASTAFSYNHPDRLPSSFSRCRAVLTDRGYDRLLCCRQSPWTTTAVVPSRNTRTRMFPTLRAPRRGM